MHSHVVGNGQCVLLAPNGGEQHVELPHAEENTADITSAPAFMSTLSLGQPGEVGEVYVAYTADAGVLTADTRRLCGGVFLND